MRPSIADSSAQQKAVLGALTKKDPNITRVVDTAAHVALYEFDEVKQVWVRGPLRSHRCATLSYDMWPPFCLLSSSLPRVPISATIARALLSCLFRCDLLLR